jgi:hypothetical protein
VTFTRAGLPAVRAAFPAFVPFLDAALLPGCDAFVLNPLLVQDGKGVAPHVDASLDSHVAGAGHPAAVSVLYVQVPAGLAGGQLRLTQRGREVACLSPLRGALLTFRGDLMHEVTPIQGGAPGAEAARISLVVEQYVLAPAELAQVPAHALISRAGMAMGMA